MGSTRGLQGWSHIAVVHLFLLWSRLGAALEPGDLAPAPIEVETLAGRRRFGPPDLPLLVAALDSEDAFSRYMWRDEASLRGFLTTLPPGTSVLFLSHAAGRREARREVRWMQSQLQAQARQLSNASGGGSGGGTGGEAALRALERMHFAVEPAARLGGWLPGLLAGWPTPRRVMAARTLLPTPGQRGLSPSQAAGGGPGPSTVAGSGHGVLIHLPTSLRSTRLDADYSWVPWPVTGVKAPLALAGADCAWIEVLPTGPSPTAGSSSGGLNGSVALILLTAFPGAAAAGEAQPGGGTEACSYSRMLRAAEAAGAAAALVAAPPGAEVSPVRCGGAGECGTAVGIPVTMVPHCTGAELEAGLHAGGITVVEFLEEEGPGLVAGVGSEGRLFEVGWLKWPSLMHVAWAAQWQQYLGALAQRLAAPALEVRVFERTTMDAAGGADATATLPPAEALAGRPRLELDFGLGCAGPRDASCPAWDHALQLFVCCEDREGALPACDPCRPTLWRSGPAAAAGPQSTATDQGGSSGGGDRRCGRELGRWMTPFRRGVGRWLSDVTHYRPLLPPGATCAFRVQSTGWAGDWRPTLTLRFAAAADGSARSSGSSSDGGGSSRGRDTMPHSSGAGGSGEGAEAPGAKAPAAGAPAPPAADGSSARLLALPFNGGVFNGSYNTQQGVFSFATPPGLRRAVLVARITGHGSDENGCAEFCPTTHRWEVNGRRHSLAFSAAGTQWGCADRVLEGVVPNEHGTWQYGRGGWCNGRDVKPWEVDVTGDLRPEGQANSLLYVGLYRGQDAVPQGAPGYMMVQSNLVLYTDGGGEGAPEGRGGSGAPGLSLGRGGSHNDV